MVNRQNRFHKRRATMNYVGIDLHKKTITIYVVNQERQKVDHKRLACLPSPLIVDYFKKLGPFQAVIEATASYDRHHGNGNIEF
jgi:transposase